ncbi:MAG: methyltransferase domain-containing protein [Candidatus Woesearchaeota archaeon]
MDVYEPEEDSYLLAGFVPVVVKKKSIVLDMGCGSGILSNEAIKHGAYVIGADINPNAIIHCKENIPKGIFVTSDLFNYFEQNYIDIVHAHKATPYTHKATKYKKKTYKKEDVASIKKRTSKTPRNLFDIILFNAPYLPDAEDPEDIRAYTTGGKHGYEIIERFLQSAYQFLHDNGTILLVFSNLSKKKKIDELIDKKLYSFKELGTASLFFEKLYCYSISKTPVLTHLQKLGVSNLQFYSKGKRGMVYQGTFKGKKSAIKVLHPKTHAFASIRREGDNLQKANALGIGPQLYYADDLVVIMAFIEGETIIPYIEKQKKKPAKIYAVLKNILLQLSTLDKKGLKKHEMVRPLKHIIVRDDVPIMIDFERMSHTQKPGNVSQYMQFLGGDRFATIIGLSRSEGTKLTKEYMKTLDTKPILKKLKELLTKKNISLQGTKYIKNTLSKK